MTRARNRQTPSQERILNRFRPDSRTRYLVFLLILVCVSATATPVSAQEDPRESYIPVLCVTGEHRPTGMVVYLMVLFAKRSDTSSLDIHFLPGPGRFSDKAKISMRQAITGAAHAMGLSTNTWNVGLSIPYPGLLIDGDSLSAMVGLTAVAMANGKTIPPHHVISGTITIDGRIGPVGHVELKVAAAHRTGPHTIILPSATRNERPPPPFVQVSHIRTVHQAYQALLAPSHLLADDHQRESDANRS